ncbi:NAD-dependent epimerase/dehydratase family protein [Bordetella avium]|uniref:NAD-dependent epimerase/dehydratase family protein n=1 Tax=Bordetella avium TaxID=521 RepID=UPI000E68AA2F|nr:NAD-dependent epimerase/dehydratase family protein [Bordetella avium]AZY52023.1 NAD(P)-dependent oxidoreductase [Bordetella avium]RIQ16975.1 NAD-dependent epimerase/dehydratase family protein [Bordetella avium]RIQ36299.1 NAD-dependent epimerase/dehydratase family protein [Bordetella avium]
MTQTILLAGCGDLGLRVAERLLARGDEVWGLRRQPPASFPAGMRWITADLADPASLAGLPQHIQRVAYLPTPGAREPERYRAVFLHGQRHLLAALNRKPERWVFVSSSAVYGEHSGQWIDEDSPTSPQGFNGRILLEAEQALQTALPGAVSLRLAGLYGPGRTQLLQRLRQGQARAAADHWANRMHIDDAAAALDHLLHIDAPLPCYLGVDDTPMLLDQLYGELARMLNAPPPEAGPPPADVGSKRLSNQRLKSSGFALRWPDTIAGYRELINCGMI